MACRHAARVPSLQSKDICKLYFEQEGPKLWRCSCGTTRTQDVGKGYLNLMSHIYLAHPNYKNQFFIETGKNTSKFTQVSSKANNLYGWLEWVIMESHPFDFPERAFVRKYSSLQPISDDTLKKFMGLLTVAVEKKISTDIPKKIGLIIDGWTHGTTRYCACLLLSIASFLNECDLGVSSMRDFIDARYLFLAVM